MVKFTIRDLIYLTAIIALFAVWQSDRQRSQLTPEEQQVIEGLRRYQKLRRAQEMSRTEVDRIYDVNERLLERDRSSA